jgi:hypothetical protein
MKTNFRTFCLAVTLMAAFVVAARAATVTATLDPAEISMGDSTQLTVTVSGAQGQPSVPNVDGLDITPVGQSTQIEIVNGSITANASYTYNITPQRDGTFVIPALRLSNASSQPLTLHVTKTPGITSAPAPQTAQQQPQNSGSGPVVQPPPNAAPDQNAPQPTNRYGGIQISLPKKQLFVGETVPVDIKVILPERFQAEVQELPQFTSDGFALNALGTKPEQDVEMWGGQPCRVLTWHSALTAIKTGDYPVHLQEDEQVVVPIQRRQNNDDDDDIFGGFFRQFAQMGQRKNVAMQSDPLTLTVLPLPQENRPAGFGGAVGQFDVEASATPTKVNAGDPVTLRLKISGMGDFDRVSSDLVSSSAQWKTYSTKTHFDANDSAGYTGTKTIEQPIIPADSTVTSIPSLSFSYFDPDKREYVTRTTPPIPVEVTGTAVASTVTPGPVVTPASTPPPSAQPPAAAPAALAGADGLRAIKIEPGNFASTLRPVYLSPMFIAGQALPLVALLAGLLFIRQRDILSHPSRLRATAIQLAIRQEVSAMDEAMKNQQTEVFFIHARAALQQRLGEKWNMRPETITLAEVERHAGACGENVRPIFEMADQASYSDLHFEDADLRQWREAVLAELAEKN